MKRHSFVLSALLCSVIISGCSTEQETSTDNSGYVQEESTTEEKTTEETTTVTLESLNINPHDIMEYIGEAPEGADAGAYITEYEVIQTEPFILKVRNRAPKGEGYKQLNKYLHFSKEGFLYKYNDVWYQQIVNMDNIKNAFFYDLSSGLHDDNDIICLEGQSADGSYTYNGAVGVIKDAAHWTPDMENHGYEDISDCKTFEITKDNRTYYIGLVYNTSEFEEYKGMCMFLLAYTYLDDNAVISASFTLYATEEPIFKNPEMFMTEEYLNNFVDVSVYD